MRNVLVTGASTPLGRALLAHLRGREGVERIVGVGALEGSGAQGGVESLPPGADHRRLVAALAERRIDTVVHCGLAPDRSGSHDRPQEARVIDTMRLGAAIGSGEHPARAWLVASSSAVYPVTSRGPLLHREDGDLEAAEGTLGASVVEAEDYVRDVAERTPHLNVAILRLQQLVGEGVRSPLACLLRQPVLPAVVGFDPPLQLLALEDAVSALAFAGELELAGVYNVASAGIVRFGEARRALGRRALPVLPLEAGPFSGLARRLGVPHVPDGMLGLLRFGHALDTAKLTAAGFDPDCDQAACLELLRVGSAGRRAPRPAGRRPARAPGRSAVAAE